MQMTARLLPRQIAGQLGAVLHFQFPPKLFALFQFFKPFMAMIPPHDSAPQKLLLGPKTFSLFVIISWGPSNFCGITSAGDDPRRCRARVRGPHRRVLHRLEL